MTYAGNKQLNISGRHWLQRLLAGLLAMVLAVGCLPVAARSTETETDPTEYTEATDPSETTEATDPSETTEATDPSETTEATDPSETTEATDPSETAGATDPSETTEATDPTAATDSTEPAVIDGGDTPDYSGDVEKYATLNPDYGDYIVVLDITPDETWETYGDLLLYLPEDFSEDACFEVTGWKVVSVTYSDYDDEGSEYSYTSQSLWYQVSVVEGTAADFADGYWILQNFLNAEDAYEQDVLILTDPPEDPSEPTDPTDPPVLEDEENGTGITVSAESFPDGAELEAQDHSATVESDAGIYDIKVYRTDEEGNRVEWQPIDDGQTVEISIPVPGVADGEYVDVYHFIDYALDIDNNDDNEFVISTADAPQEWLDILQPALDAYGDGVHVAVEVTRAQASGGAVTIITDSFSVYNPQYQDQGDNFTVSFTSSSTEDPANNKTYYITEGETIKFTFTYEGFQDHISLVDIDQDGKYTLTRLSDNSVVKDQDVADSTEEVLESAWYGKTMRFTEYVSYTFTEESLGIENLTVGELFEIYWQKTNWKASKNPRWTRVMIVGEYPTTFKVNGGQWEDGTTTDLAETIVSYEPVNNVPTPTRDGHKFLGWSNVQDGSGGTLYEPGTDFPATLPTNGTLYAMWEPASYTVTYVLPDGVANADVFEDQTKYHGVHLPLYAESPQDIDDNTKFLGWDINNTGDVVISKEQWEDRDTYPDGYLYTEDADLTLVSMWDDAVYTVVYKPNGGDTVPGNQYLDTSTETTSITLTRELPTRSGYEFIGWNTEEDGTGTAYDTRNADIVLTAEDFGGKNLVLHAQWRVIRFKVEFNPGTETYSGSTDAISNLYYESSYANLTANGFTHGDDSQIFQGWALESGANSVLYTNGQNVRVKDMVDLARAQDKVTYTDVTDEDTDEQYKQGTIVLYAVWATKTFTIYYEASGTDTGESITKLSQTVIWDSGAVIDSTATRTRHTFAGWSYEGNLYQSGDAVPTTKNGVEIGHNESITLTATWKANMVGYICEMVNGSPSLLGTVQIGDQSATGYLTVPMATSDTDGYPEMNFTIPDTHHITRMLVQATETNPVEWTEAQINKFIANGYSYTHEGTLSSPLFVAIIVEKNSYTITFDPGEGSFPDNTTTQYTLTYGADTSGVTFPTPTAPTGMTFTGWNTELPATMPASNITITAQYDQNPSKVTITWDYLCFDFSKSSGWDPTTHLYSNIPALDGSDTHNSVTVKVEQFASTDASIGVSIRYDSLAAYSMITGVFSVDDGANTSAKVETGEATLDDDKTSVTFYLWLSGSMEPPAQNEDVQVGNCYITLTSNYKIETDVYKSEGE